MIRIAIVGLGYVGLQLANLFASKYSVVGYDISEDRINDLKAGFDTNLELTSSQLRDVQKSKLDNTIGLFITNRLLETKECNYFIVTVPTPVDKFKRPDLQPLMQACEQLGGVIKKNDIIIFESTVYPGLTEEVCVPILEKISEMKFNEDFFIGYSPERINPGDKLNTIDNTIKITAGSTPEIGVKVNLLYQSVIKSGTFLASTIKIAEAAKIVENTQRDINIAFINEVAKIFNLMNIDVNEVLRAAGTKWNFSQYKPGFVGGHCIGVDPYYLVHKSLEFGYYPEIIMASRIVNESMPKYVCSHIIQLMIKKGINISKSRLLVLGASFKDNSTQIKNTKTADLIKAFQEYNLVVDCFDPLINKDEFYKEFGVSILSSEPNIKYDAVIVAVAHNVFLKYDVKTFLKENSVYYDFKGLFIPENELKN